MEFGTHPREISIVESGLALDPLEQGQRQVDDEVERENRPVQKPVLGQRSPVRGPRGQELAKRRAFRRVLVDVAVFFNGRAGRGLVLADENVHGGILKRRDAPHLCKDVEIDQGAPGDFRVVAWLSFDDSSVGPVLEAMEHARIVLGHLNGLSLGLFEVSVECGLEEGRSVTK